MKHKNPNNNDIITKLTSSTAMQSLVMEHDIASKLYNLKWDVVHSCYYNDTRENKIREIDVTGTQAWICHKKKDTSVVRLHLVIECKSAKGFHLLFSPLISGTHITSLNDEWFGLDDQLHRTRFAETLADMKVEESQKTEIYNHYKKIIYADEGIHSFRLDTEPFPASCETSAFRETNIGADKEMETSVLWKAGLALSSAVSSFKDTILIETLDDISFVVDIDSLYGEENILKTAIEQLDFHSGQLDLYHPIVVIDSKLWQTKNSKPKKINWCRLIQSDISGFGNWWFDIVSYEYFDNYISKLTRHYKDQYRKYRASLIKLHINRNN